MATKTFGAGLLACALVLTGLAPVAANSTAEPVKGDRELGEYLSSQCTGCHQISGVSVGGVPPIVAMPDDQFIAIMDSYKEGIRENETMRVISHRLSQEEIAALAAYFGSLPDLSAKK